MAAATVVWSHTSARWIMTRPRPAAFRMFHAGAGWRTATRTFNPSPARRRTSRRPRNPEPPNTTTMVMAYLLRQARRAHPAEEMSGLDQYLVSLKCALRKRDVPRSVQDFSK